MIVLLYHKLKKIGDEIGKKGNEIIYSTFEDKFEEQMNCLFRRGYQAISLCHIVNASKAVITPERGVVITFDDGHISNYTMAYPILRKHRFKATFFITAGWIGLPDYLSWDQIKEMDNNGMEIGSHTITHPYLTRLNRERIKFELAESKKILEDGLGKSVDFLAIPGSFCNKAIKEIAKEVGYLGVCTGRWKPGYKYNDPYDLKRLGIKGYLSMSDFMSFLEMRGSVCFYRHVEVFLKSLVKKGLGIDRYCWIRDRWIALRGREISRDS